MSEFDVKRSKDISKAKGELIEKQKEYIDLLAKEIDSMLMIAHVHGWKSSNEEEGKTIRKEIRVLEGTILSTVFRIDDDDDSKVANVLFRE